MYFIKYQQIKKNTSHIYIITSLPKDVIFFLKEKKQTKKAALN